MEAPRAGFIVHSRLARIYAAAGREHPLAGAAAHMMTNLAVAQAEQNVHWGGVQDHLDERGIYGSASAGMTGEDWR